MALSNAEKQKRWREKQKALKAGLIMPERKPDPVDLSFLLDGFGEWIRRDRERWESVDQLDSDELRFLLKAGNEKAEVVFTENAIRHFELALDVITALLHGFRVERINEEIARIQREELDEPASRERAIEKIVQLREALAALGKKYRREFHEYELPGLIELVQQRAAESTAQLE